MKKFLKVVVIVFVLVGIVKVTGVMAIDYTGHIGFAGISIPNLSGIYISPEAWKSEYGPQYAYKISAIDKVSGDERAVQARVNGSGYTTWITLPKGQLKSWGGQVNTGGHPYKIEIMHSTTNIWSGSSFYGDWYLDYLG